MPGTDGEAGVGFQREMSFHEIRGALDSLTRNLGQGFRMIGDVTCSTFHS